MTTPGGNRPDDMFDFGGRRRRQQAPPETGSRGKRLGGADPGTVALGMTGMAFYWLGPMLMSGRRRGRLRPNPPPDRA